MVTKIEYTEKDMDVVKKHLPNLLIGKCPKSKKIKQLLGDVISSKRAKALLSNDTKSAEYLFKLLCVVYPENEYL